MARNIDSGLMTQMAGASVAPAFLVQFDFDTAPLRLWSGTLTASGNDFTGAGPLLNISATQETSQMQALGMTLRLNGLSNSILSLALGEPYQGRTLSLWVAAIDLQTHALIGVPYLVFKGRMDVMEILETGETCDITLSCENMLIDLDRPRLRYYTAEDQAIDFPDDRGFDMVPALQDAAVKWGG